MNFEKVYETALSCGCKAERDVPMRDYTTFKIGGNARLMITPCSDESLKKIVKASVCF